MPAAKRGQRTQAPHPLAHLIPDEADYETYIRRLVGGYWDLDILQYAHDTGKNVMLKGPTGLGKTKMVHAYCAWKKIPLVTVQCNGGIDPNTFWGGPGIGPDGQLLPWIDSNVKRLIQAGHACLYIDEPNFAHPRVMAGFHDLTDWRRQVTILEHSNDTFHAGDGLLIVTAYNEAYEGTRPLNPAFKRRFKIKMTLDYDEAVEGQLVSMPVLLELANNIRTAPEAILTPVSTDMLTEFEELVIDLDLEFARANFLNAFDADERDAVNNAMELLEDRLIAESDALKAQSA